MTVDELAAELALTPVTVRHHLDILKSEGLVECPEVRRRDTPGRPQYAFQLTPAAQAHFPKNYQAFARLMLAEIRDHVAESDLQRMVAGVAQRMAAEAALPGPEAPLRDRAAAAARYLNQRGYEASVETRDDGTIALRTRNCPYHDLSREHDEFCALDLALVTRLIGGAPAVQERISTGGMSCAYLVAPLAAGGGQPD